MICVTIGRGRHKSLLAEWKEAAAAGAELVELRIDILRSEPNLKRLLAERPTPAVITIRRGADGGLWRGDEEKRLRLLREAIVLGVDYVDLEVDVAGSIPRFGKTKRIVSLHNFRKTPVDAELTKIVEEIRGKQADVVKVAVNAQSLADASRVLAMVARENATGPTIGIGMGQVGFFTRILGAKYGAPFTFSGFNPDRTFAPGMPRFQELRRDYGYDRIGPETAVFAVIGDPVGQSLGPAIHNAAFRHLGIDAVYLPILVPAGRLKESLTELAWLDIRGMSVTIPHKEAIVPLLTLADGAVERTGSCNTVVVKDGKMEGHNTDYHAAMKSLEDALGGVLEHDASPLINKQVLILGAGGVARSIAVGAVRRGAGVTICNRNDERAAKLAEQVGCRSVSWTMRAGTLCDILVNGTPVGMHPHVDDTPVPPAAFRPGMLVFDTVYHPENTMFLKMARERDCKTISGVDMFIEQAAAQFRMFTGQEPPVEVMREVVRRKLGAARE
ncbi:MAG TPA: shikimate dehydrogenase [Isosphaeraceae bacterium]|jgi:3-dehydroquinate dehydratase/shikimate dehydrogenase|nr:shikimate dehydrogenase [Isosphaeraceae bacterium]